MVTVWCPAALGAHLSRQDVERRPFYELLDVELRGATQTIGADLVDADDARLLGVPVGSPVLRCQRVTTDRGGDAGADERARVPGPPHRVRRRPAPGRAVDDPERPPHRGVADGSSYDLHGVGMINTFRSVVRFEKPDARPGRTSAASRRRRSRTCGGSPNGVCRTASSTTSTAARRTNARSRATRPRSLASSSSRGSCATSAASTRRRRSSADPRRCR